MKRFFAPMATVAVSAMATLSSAQFFDDFDVDHTANWVVNRSDGDANNNRADFFFDYSTVDIPSAPGAGGTTRGLKLEANVLAGVFSGLSASPIGQSFTGDFTMTAQVWLNFIGPGPAGGSGSTQLGGLGIGTAGTAAQWPGVADGVWFAATGDGGSSVDWRAYSPEAVVGYPDGSSVFSAAGTGNRNNTHSYYSNFGGQSVTIPASSGGGYVNVGAAGYMWRTWTVDKSGNMITWTVTDNDGNPVQIAQVDASSFTMGGTNILLNSSDINGSSSTTVHGRTFALFDNVRVTPVPEPASFAALGLGALALLRRRRR